MKEFLDKNEGLRSRIAFHLDFPDYKVDELVGILKLMADKNGYKFSEGIEANEEEYEMDREDAIKRCGTCPAYIVNMEEPDCSEITEFVYQNIEGMIINAS